MAESHILIEEVGPNGNVEAFVEDDGRVVYLYLRWPGEDDQETEIKAVWVANRLPAPEHLNNEELEAGTPPLNPAKYCASSHASEAMDPDSLSLVWLPEGDGVALYESEKLIAILPPWSGVQGFYGYSRDAVDDGPLAWPLNKDNALYERFDQAKVYWQSWEQEDNPWALIQSTQMGMYQQFFSENHRYFAIDGGNWPPKALTWFTDHQAHYLTTIGMALRPMPNVEMHVENPVPVRRIEVGMVLPAEADDELAQKMGGFISAVTQWPWQERTWFGHGDTLDCEILEPYGYTAVGFIPAKETNVPCPLPDFMGDPVTLMWMVPLTEDQMETIGMGNAREELERIALPRKLA